MKIFFTFFLVIGNFCNLCSADLNQRVIQCTTKIKELIKDKNKKSELSSTYRDRGFAYFELGKYAESLKDVQEARKLTPKDSSHANCIIGLYEKLGDFKAAIAEYNEKIKARPNDSEAIFNRGLLYTKLNDSESDQKALQDYNKAIEIKNSSEDKNDISWWLYCRGLLLIKLDKIAEAQNDLQDAKKLIDSTGWIDGEKHYIDQYDLTKKKIDYEISKIDSSSKKNY